MMKRNKYLCRAELAVPVRMNKPHCKHGKKYFAIGKADFLRHHYPWLLLPTVKTMMKKFVYVFLALSVLASSAHALDVERARAFIRAVASGSDSLEAFHHPDELALSQRFGIQYEGVRQKFMLGYDLAPQEKLRVLASDAAWNVEVSAEQDGWAVARLRIGSIERAFYFQDGYFVTPVRYFTRDFTSHQSRFFTILTEDPATFHPSAAQALDKFVLEAAETLELPSEKLELLEREKIVFVLCKDPESIEQLTGYRIRGMGVVSHDYVLTTYSAHYHEVAHILTALKLERELPVTHPLLREGLAVALGGRGGRDPETILDVGCFLFRSTLVELDSLCDERAYLEETVSFSYPASGIYVRFLLDELGVERFLKLYRQYSHPERDSVNCVIKKTDLPGTDSWKKWLDGWRQFEAVTPLEEIPKNGSEIVKLPGVGVWDWGDSYCFSLTHDLVFSEQEPPPGYQSSRFKELHPELDYNGCRYLISIRDGEIGVYDLYLNTLLANRVPSFIHPPPPETAKSAGPLIFSIRKALFEMPLEQLVPELLK